MLIKSQLRKELSLKRKSITDKIDKENLIFSHIRFEKIIEKSDLILFYSALADEVSLLSAVDYAFKMNKKIAFPFCTDKNGNMSFYYVSLFDDLRSGSFGILEPDTEKCEKVDDFSNAVCFVPAIAFDKKGYRLGYGKGYYDRFLSEHNVFKIGVCFSELIVDNLPINEYDIAVDALITEKGFTYIHY